MVSHILRFNFFSLRLRVLAVLTVGLAACFGVMVLHLSYAKLTALMHLGEEASRNQTMLVAAQIRTGMERQDEAHIEQAYYDLVFGQTRGGFLNPQIRMLRLFDVAGGELNSFETLEGPEIEAPAFERLAKASMQTATTQEAGQGDVLLIAEPIVSEVDHRVIGALTIAWDHSRLRSNVLNATVTQAGLGLAGALVMIVALGLAMQRLILAPLAHMMNGVERIEADAKIRNLPQDVLQRCDEIGRLGVRFQALLDHTASREALLAQSEAELDKRSKQLDAALENMSQGLCMFDHNQRLVVHNKRFTDLYGLASSAVVPQMHIQELLELCKDAGNFLSDRPASIEEILAEQFRAQESRYYLDTIKDGRVVAVSRVQMRDGGWVSTFEDITQRREAEAQIEYIAHHDALTDLPNRALFRVELEQALATSSVEKPIALLYLDLDRFKSINDSLGHPVGDELLKAVAGRLRTCLRGTSTIARLGGDEFAVIVSDVSSAENARRLAELLIEEISRSYEVGGHQVVIGTSIGVALAPANASCPDVLVKAADLALYRAKADGRGACRFFEPEMDARMQERRELELDLRQALGKHELEVHYQPIVNLNAHKVSCFEALLRWHHPVRGWVSPSEFIPLAEEIGLVGQIGAWVLQEACRAAAHWPGEVRVAVNLSPMQFRSHTVIFDVDAALDVSGLAPERLELEITEAVLLHQTELTLSLLNQLRGMGVRISLDDFGTGYSSLSYLQTFPFDKIKIDRSFIRGLDQEGQALAIVRAITSMGVSLGMSTTAEGVETPHQLEALRLEGCTEVQGYYFSPAVRAGEVVSLSQRIEQIDRPAA